MLQRLISYWVYGGVLAGILLLVLWSLLVAGWSMPLAATFLLLPAYMVHQYEEHDHDRFRLFFNETIGKGFDVLSPLAVFITNVPGVWGGEKGPGEKGPGSSYSKASAHHRRRANWQAHKGHAPV